MTSLAGATVVSVPPGPPSSSAASSAATASLPPGPSRSTTAPTTGPTSSSNGKGKGKGKRKAEASKAKVPLSWAEADRQLYATAAGKAYLAASTLADPSAAHSEQAGTQPAEVSTAQLVANGVSIALPSNVPPKRPAPPVPAPAPLAKKVVVRRFTSEGVEIHPLLTQGARGMWDRHAGRQWESLSNGERAQFDRDNAASSAPAPSTPSAPEVSSNVSLRELAVLVDLPDEEAEAALARIVY